MTKKINTLFVLPQLDRGGSETLVYNIATKMDREKFDPSLAYFNFYGNYEMIAELENNDIQLHYVPKTANLDFDLMRKLAGIVAKHEIDIINAHHFISMVYSFYACQKNKKVGLVFTEHSKWEVERTSLKWRLAGKYILNCIDGIVAVSDEVANSLRKKFCLNKSQVITIENGVDLDRFNCKDDRTTLKKRFGLDPDDKVIGVVANFRKVKNHILLLRAFQDLLTENRNLKLVLVGKGFDNDPESTQDEIMKFIREEHLVKNVLLMGYRTDIPELLAIMDIFCLTSLNEGLPISIIEAMAAGLPVVGTNVEGIRDVVKQEENGLLVNPSDQIALRRALEMLLTDEDKRLTYGNNSLKIVQGHYSLQLCINRYQNVFQKIHCNKTSALSQPSVMSH